MFENFKKLKEKINRKLKYLSLILEFVKSDEKLFQNFIYDDLNQNLKIFKKLSLEKQNEIIHLFFNFLKEIKNNNEKTKYDVICKFTSLIYPKIKITEFNNLMFEDKEFLSFYNKFMDKDNWSSFDRKFNLKNLINLTQGVEGDLVEAGAYQGFSSYIMCDFIEKNKENKTVHLFDSFEGLSDPNIFDDQQWWKKGAFETDIKIIYQNLKEFNNFKVHKGWIPEVYNTVKIEKVSFLHIDVDLYQPTKDTLEFFYDKMHSKALILFDDYNFKNCKGHKLAIDEFFIGKKENVIPISSSQAFVLIE